MPVWVYNKDTTERKEVTKMKKIELNPLDQKVLENRYKAKIRKCNENLKNCDETMQAIKTDFENTKYFKKGFTVERSIEIVDDCIEYHKAERKRAVFKLNREIRNGYIYE